jgi:2-oxoglutarate dehydrogenase E1 component
MMRTIDPDSFLSGGNSPYIVDMFHRYQESPEEVSADWRRFFQSYELDTTVFKELDDRPPQWSSHATGKMVHHPSKPESSLGTVRDSVRALRLIQAYRCRGHLQARLDPLGLTTGSTYPEFLPQTYGFSEQDMDRPIDIDGELTLQNPTVRKIYDRLRSIYCQTLGVEFMHLQNADHRRWIQERIENTPTPTENTDSMEEGFGGDFHLNSDAGSPPTKGGIGAKISSKDLPEIGGFSQDGYTPVEDRVDPADRLAILKHLIAAHFFEHFLQTKYPSVKRFGLEGGESLIPSLEVLLERLGEQGVNKFVFGMAHRGRLNVLANIIHKPLQNIFAQFRGEDIDPAALQGSGDVKYHLGYSKVRKIGHRQVTLSMMHNPSHLESVNPIVLGKVRAEQDAQKDEERGRTVPILIHGDAAFVGQGIVAESLELSGLEGYRTGGTIHLIINNQIGFTTSPSCSRSSLYCSDPAKAIQAPIFHVNGDDPEAVVWILRVALDFYRKFSQDVVVDLVCYRRHGHNEIDEPSFTQPLMYQKIAEHPPIFQRYSETLIESAALTREEVDRLVADYEGHLRSAFEGLTETQIQKIAASPQWLEGAWKGIKPDKEIDLEKDMCPETGVPLETLHQIANTLVTFPKGFRMNARLQRVLTAKHKSFEGDGVLDWAAGEGLSFGSLLLEGKRVRLSGQDVVRGTFSHRHAVWVDQETEESYAPLNHLALDQAQFDAIDSPLSEAAVLGFEYGYTLANPHALVLWEAQFGDFSNGAQVIIDQYISSGEQKWQRLSGLVMLLPHGCEGQGPEHSSARLERYLQLCAENNMRVVNCTTPANYFHVLRRQLISETRKPLVVMSPKSLLRHKLAVSTYADMEPGTTFLPVIGEIHRNPSSINRVVLCGGKVYYDLLHERENHQLGSVALIRLEQYYPFPHSQLKEALKPYAHAEFIWCQEEPHNMGAWMFVDRRLEAVLKDIGARAPSFQYVGRPSAASPATGNSKKYAQEQAVLLEGALGN